jgi:PadR family transcriptional regulator, regulatory protein PadR
VGTVLNRYPSPCDISGHDVSSRLRPSRHCSFWPASRGGERHGYAIAQDVEELSEGRVKLTAGTLYGALNRLAQGGLIAQTREQEVGGRRRRYYRLTSLGETALVEEAARLRSTAAALSARAAIGADPSVRPT